ncbi:MAG: DUF971 domain-containing protein [Caldilineae bacterium]|nr:MAG: DUF971 domain-containing protein [Caldilineae bacterium]
MTDPATHRPQALTVDREACTLTIVWADGHESVYPLAWLRQTCPCASCQEERSAAESDPLRLQMGTAPSAEVVDAELVGNYAVRFVWGDGHNSGIYGFADLRAACPCPLCRGNS